MIIPNLVIFLIALGFVGAGIKDGFVYTLGRLVGSIIGFLAARAWSLKVSGFLAFFMPAAIAQAISFVLIFILITQLIGLGFKLLDGIFKILSFIPFLKSINSILGAVAGLGEGIIILGGIFFLIKRYFQEPHLVTWISSSIIAQWIEMAFNLALQKLL